MKSRMAEYYMDIAIRTSHLSRAIRKKVGAVVVKDDRIISIGYNGMPSGWDNECENWVKNDGVMFEPEERDRDIYCSPVTKPEVLHAEANAITKLARSTESGDNAAIFVTYTPCMECAKLIYQSGISDVYYNEDYLPKKGSGISFLKDCDINVEQIK